jgi:hypothetical protein
MRHIENGGCEVPAQDADDPDRIFACFRSGRLWLRRRPAAPGRESYRVHPLGRVYGGQAAGIAYGDCAQCQVNRNHVQPRHAPYVGSYYLPALEATARSFKVTPIAAPVHSDADIETVITSLGREPGGGLIVMPDGFMVVHRTPIISLATRNNVPAVYDARFYVRDGGLLSYGPDEGDMFHRAASYVDRILRGEKPAELPV